VALGVPSVYNMSDGQGQVERDREFVPQGFTATNGGRTACSQVMARWTSRSQTEERGVYNGIRRLLRQVPHEADDRAGYSCRNVKRPADGQRCLPGVRYTVNRFLPKKESKE
jgi:hypothetical protein